MNGITNPIVFYPAAVVMILFALLSIKFNNIFYSLLSAIIVFFIALNGIVQINIHIHKALVSLILKDG